MAFLKRLTSGLKPVAALIAGQPVKSQFDALPRI